jgi:hypothetical protein
MNEIAVIRRNADEFAAAVDAVRAAFAETIDIHRWDQVRIERVDSNGQVTAYLGGKPMDELRAVLHLGAPSHGKPWPTREEIYVQQEREQSLLAALTCCRQVKIVNRPIVMAWNRGPLEPPGQLRTLAKIGWATPTITQSFELAGDATSKLREPEPDPAAQDLVVIGLRRHARGGRAAAATTPVPALDALIAKTQLHMREHGLDVCTIPIAITAAGPVAYGMHAGVSADIGREALIHILREALT